MSQGFKNYIQNNRDTLHTLTALEGNPKYSKFEVGLQFYKGQIKKELYDKCVIIVKLVRNQCLTLASDDEAKTYMYKNMADFWRYATEGANE